LIDFIHIQINIYFSLNQVGYKIEKQIPKWLWIFTNKKLNFIQGLLWMKSDKQQLSFFAVFTET